MADILLLSGYHALSQAHWCKAIQQFSGEHNWVELALPARYFSWRMRGNPLSFAAINAAALEQHYDLIIATSSVDLATLQSLYPALRQCTSVLYFHENQFAYPAGNTPQHTIDWQITSLYSALRADFLIFNSAYNKNSFLEGVATLLNKMPDLVPKNISNDLLNKSSVLPVPINDVGTTPIKKPLANSLTVLWNHRWEWDKQPQLLYQVVKQVDQQKLPIKFIITGQSFRTTPSEFYDITNQYSHLVKHQGFVEKRSDYEQLLQQADVVLSTAIHEFQGISVLEAASLGCVPLLPNKLSYPEFFDAAYLYDGSGSITEQANAICQQLQQWLKDFLPPVVDTKPLQCSTLRQLYRHSINKWLTTSDPVKF